MDNQQKQQFIDTLLDYYRQHKRQLPWREFEIDEIMDPYKILVSEIMLQQTQALRVVPYYQQFVMRFPDFETLANSDLLEVLRLWQGLGYNRRARFLREAAREVVHQFNGILPEDIKALTALPGVGVNTAGAVLAYAFNKPVVFIETNIRTVYLYHFFQDTNQTVNDQQLVTLISETMDQSNPREFYWALMDYGTYLKNQGVRINRISKHYSKQSMFKGSLRELRGKIVAELQQGPVSYTALDRQLNDVRFQQAIESLLKDQLISVRDDYIFIAT